MRKQLGYINMDLSGLFVFAIIGLIASAILLFVGLPYGIYWLTQHVVIVW